MNGRAVTWAREVSPTNQPRIAGLTGLRAVAAIVVVAGSVGQLATPVFAGSHPYVFALLGQGFVFFFVLSGFLLYLPFAARLLDSRPGPPFLSYAIARILRVWPAYLVVLIVVAYLLEVAARPGGGVGIISGKTFVADATLLSNYDKALQRSGLEISWALTAIVTFSLVLPLVVAVVRRLLARIRPATAAWIPVLFFVFTGLTTKAVLLTTAAAIAPGPPPSPQGLRSLVEYSLASSADAFGIGMAAALGVVGFRAGTFSARLASLVRGIVAVVGIVSIPVFLLGVVSPFQSTVAAVICACAVLFVALADTRGRRARTTRFLEWGPVRFLGVLSFGILLWHVVAIRFAQAHGLTLGGGRLGFVATVVVVLVVSVVLATLLHLAVERPVARLRGWLRGSLRRQHSRRLVREPESRKSAQSVRDRAI